MNVDINKLNALKEAYENMKAQADAERQQAIEQSKQQAQQSNQPPDSPWFPPINLGPQAPNGNGGMPGIASVHGYSGFLGDDVEKAIRQGRADEQYNKGKKRDLIRFGFLAVTVAIAAVKEGVLLSPSIAIADSGIVILFVASVVGLFGLTQDQPKISRASMAVCGCMLVGKSISALTSGLIFPGTLVIGTAMAGLDMLMLYLTAPKRVAPSISNMYTKK